jgi:hypothetical protein
MKPTILTMFIPDEALPLLLAMAGFLIILGFRKAAGGMIGLVLISACSPLFEPIVEALIDSLPGWALLLLVFFLLLKILRFVGELFLGPEVWGGVFSAFILWLFRSRLFWWFSVFIALRLWFFGI